MKNVADELQFYLRCALEESPDLYVEILHACRC